MLRKLYQPENFAPGASEAYEKNPEFEKIPEIESNRDKYDIISFYMKPGDLLAFHALVVHGSAGNFSKVCRRRGYAVRYTGKNVFYSTETSQFFISVHGNYGWGRVSSFGILKNIVSGMERYFPHETRLN